MKNRVLKRAVTLSLGLCLAILGATALSSAADSSVGRVNYVEGVVEIRSPKGPWTPAQVGRELKPGDEIRTGTKGKKNRVEIMLADNSIVRLGSKSLLVLDQAVFGGTDRKFSAQLQRGQTYAKAAKARSDGSMFEIKTGNAVAGVRGTAFRIDAKTDQSTVVRVYSGAVAVSNAPLFAKPGKATPTSGKAPQVPRQGVKPGGPGRVEVAGPQEVTKKQWEELVAKAMQEIRVAADGTMSEPTQFAAEEDSADEWVAWNQSRDALTPEVQ